MDDKNYHHGAKFVCAFPSCNANYTQKLKLQDHLRSKHGLDRDEQVRFYNCFPEGSLEMSPMKRGPKTYIPSRFECPTKKLHIQI